MPADAEARGGSAVPPPLQPPQPPHREHAKENSEDDGAALPALDYIRDIRTGQLVPVHAMEMPSVLRDDFRRTVDEQRRSILRRRQRRLHIRNLQVGDVLFVLETSIVGQFALGLRAYMLTHMPVQVSWSQMLSRLFTGAMGRSGGADSVHCCIVVETSRTHAIVAHVTNDGGQLSLMQDVSTTAATASAAAAAAGSADVLGEARVYRLSTVHSAVSIPCRAAEIAAALVQSGAVTFSRTNSIISAFRDPAVGRYLQQAYAEPLQVPQQRNDASMQLFCTEFVIKCYQAALLRGCGSGSRELVSAIDVDGSACTPMFFEGFLRQNSGASAQWTELGTLRFEYG